MSGFLRKQHRLQISHETIYRHIWHDRRCGGKLHQHLRGARKRFRKRYRSKGAIHHVLALQGGIAPVARRRCPVALVLDEREEISRGIAAGLVQRAVLQWPRPDYIRNHGWRIRVLRIHLRYCGAPCSLIFV